MLADINMNRISGTVIAVIVGLSLGATAAGNVVGDVVASHGASVNGVTVPGEWTVASGDALTTNEGGSALVHLSTSSQARLSENTSVVFERDSNQVTARMSSGTLGVEERGRDNLVTKTDEFTVQSALPGDAEYVVAMLPDRAIISARRGEISVIETGSGVEHIVPQGHYGTISRQDDSSSGTSSSNAKSKKKAAAAAKSGGLLHNGTFMFAVAAGAGIGLAAAIGYGALGSSPASPSEP